MAWDHLDIDEPHLAYMILGGFTGLFMLCSLFVKEKLYIGEATVATLCGIIFGPHAANLFNPMEWGNVDKITLECSRIVLVVQCFAVGVELPKAYMERHWKSVCLLLVPVMTYGWLVTSLFIWWMVPKLNWLDSLVCAACVTATDPVLASSVVGKGKFAKRVPKHLRDLLSAESGCNDGMAFPFIYLSYYILAHRPHVGEVALNWFCITILYECILGAIYGFTIGYLARHAIKWAESKQLIDRESFLVFYFVLAVFCAGSGSLLGMDDLLIGFSCGVGFSNDGWFTEKTEESHVSNVIDLLLNLAYFVYFGSIIPWEDYNSPSIGLVPWRLVVIALLVIFFRRIPVMLLLKPVIPDVKTWREALFAGHFGPIGVGAIFAAILARAEVENGTTQPLAESEFDQIPQSQQALVNLIWPITTFLVISSILVHGSSIAVFTLGKRINTLTLTLSYTTANEEGPSWMNRLPRVQSLAKGSVSFRKADEVDESSNEKLDDFAPGTLPPVGIPGNFLRRVRDEDKDKDKDNDSQSRTSARQPVARRRRRAPGVGGPISQSAIAPQRRPEGEEEDSKTSSEEHERDRVEGEASPPGRERDQSSREPELEVYLEGHHMIIEDEEGNVLATEDISHMSQEEQARHIEQQRARLERDGKGEFAKSKSEPHEKNEGEELENAVEETVGRSFGRLGRWAGLGKGGRAQEPKDGAEKPEKKVTEKPAKPKTNKPKTEKPEAEKPAKGKARSAHAYQFGNTIIVEDEDGEVLKKYSIPAGGKAAAEPAAPSGPVRRGLTRMGTWLGAPEEGQPSQTAVKEKLEGWVTDDGLRFTVADNEEVDRKGVEHKGHRMNKQEFIRRIQKLDPKSRRNLVEETDAPIQIKHAAADVAREADIEERRKSVGAGDNDKPAAASGDEPRDGDSLSGSEVSEESAHEVPGGNVAASLARFTQGTSADERRNTIDPAQSPTEESRSQRPRPRRDSEDDGTLRVPPSQLRQIVGLSAPPPQQDLDDTGETPAERRRRLAALGELNDSDDGAVEDSDSEDDGGFRPVHNKVQFADGTKPSESHPEAGTGAVGSSTDGAGGSSSSRTGGRRSRHRPRISWGGEKGREDDK